VEVLAADLSKLEDLLTVERRITEDQALELLINNAGFGGYMPFVELDPEKATELINLKVLAVTRLTRAALPGMLARGRGAIINVSSRLAFSAPLGSTQLPKRAVYAGSNAYINTFSELLQSELEGTGVQVQALCPGVVETEFHERVGIQPGRYPAAMVMKPEDVVQASLIGLKLGEVICVPPLEDPALLTQIQEDQKRFFERSRTGALAPRYRT
jgi:short-subunit dehydrogenase